MIKNYQHLHPHRDDMIFEMKRMEDIYDLRAGASDEPHRHDYYTLLIVESASGKHTIDFQEYDLADNQLYFVSPGQVHQIIETKKSKGVAITFHYRFLKQHGISDQLISDIHLFKCFGESSPIAVNQNALNQLLSHCIQIKCALRDNIPFKMDVIGAYMKLLLIDCYQASETSHQWNTQATQVGLTLLKDFKRLVDDNFHKQHLVGFYADSLAITSDYLNRSIRGYTGQTAKEYIQHRIIIEAKRLLLFSNSTAKEISYTLGFKEPAHFSNFFKKQNGVSISEFKK